MKKNIANVIKYRYSTIHAFYDHGNLNDIETGMETLLKKFRSSQSIRLSSHILLKMSYLSPVLDGLAGYTISGALIFSQHVELFLWILNPLVVKTFLGGF